ncbi:DNA-directed RNA polymerase subunit beta [Vagococcus salmoninarum]|uniref:DNA-directed RNA polymerase subunit beta n=1 Tax=Vagococcus salmoninarum TaxID=2739 RepID=A0A429ZMP9_9ENTE|nr:DNA-directed RNA polymerase subunit beta [Vagococcus salmoninarum]RST94990.1 DNA-directed RNA polymerase subunit beta [Vagococcus salmoninarum]
MGISTKYVIRQLLKIIVIVLLAVILFVVGTMIGFGVIGEGRPTDVFDSETWNHIFKFIK